MHRNPMYGDFITDFLRAYNTLPVIGFISLKISWVDNVQDHLIGKRGRNSNI